MQVAGRVNIGRRSSGLTSLMEIVSGEKVVSIWNECEGKVFKLGEANEEKFQFRILVRRLLEDP